MSTMHSSPPSDAASPPREARWRRMLERSLLRTALGLAVLAAIIVSLAVLERLLASDDALGALDGRTPEIGEIAPQFALRDPGGDVVELSDFVGEPIWINFWATWCGPCERELPEIQRLAREFGDDGLVVLAVNQEQSAKTATEFWEELDLDIPILLDADGDVSTQYRLRGLPRNFFIDREGVVRSLPLGFLTESQMREHLAGIGLE